MTLILRLLSTAKVYGTINDALAMLVNKVNQLEKRTEKLESKTNQNSQNSRVFLGDSVLGGRWLLVNLV